MVIALASQKGFAATALMVVIVIAFVSTKSTKGLADIWGKNAERKKKEYTQVAMSAEEEFCRLCAYLIISFFQKPIKLNN